MRLAAAVRRTAGTGTTVSSDDGGICLTESGAGSEIIASICLSAGVVARTVSCDTRKGTSVVADSMLAVSASLSGAVLACCSDLDLLKTTLMPETITEAFLGPIERAIARTGF